MGFDNRLAILVDGGFLRKKLAWFNRKRETADDIKDYCKKIIRLDQFRGYELFRIYYYDAEPTLKSKPHFLTGEQVEFSNQEWVRSSMELIDRLKMKKDFAVRLGQLKFRGWKLNREAMRRLQKEFLNQPKGFTLLPEDFTPDTVQKGVDMRIGLDIANLAVKRIADRIVIVSGDTDMIPAMKLARKEGIKVYIDYMGQKHHELDEHADEVIWPLGYEKIQERIEEDRKR